MFDQEFKPYDGHRAKIVGPGLYDVSEVFDTPKKARSWAKRKLAKSGGTYEILSRLARGTSAPGCWSGGECGEVEPSAK